MTSSALKFKAFFLYFVFFSSLLYYCGHDYYLIIKCLGLSTALIIFISIFFPITAVYSSVANGRKKKKNQIHVKDNFKSMCLNLKWCVMVVLTHHNYHFTSGLH